MPKNGPAQLVAVAFISHVAIPVTHEAEKAPLSNLGDKFHDETGNWTWDLPRVKLVPIP